MYSFESKFKDQKILNEDEKKWHGKNKNFNLKKLFV